MAQATQPRAASAGGRRIIERPRLLKLLSEATARTILLVAPAGYGKTTLARQWLEANPGGLFAIGLAGGDVAVIARSLGAALAEPLPGLPRIAEEAIRAGPTPELQVKSFVHATLGEIEKPLDHWLVIDDYHLVEAGSPADALVETLEASGKFRLIVASRTRPSWATPRRFLYGDLVELTQTELALDDEESAALLAGREAGGLDRSARGWPALVALAAVAGGSGKAPVGAESGRLYEFFADEVFSSAPAVAQDALLRVALLPALGHEPLSEILGPATVEAVLRTGLVHEAAGVIEAHPLVRGFLYEKIRRADLAAAVSEGIEFAVRGEYWDEAFELITQFARNEYLEELVTNSFLPLVESGRLATLSSFGVYAAKAGGVPQAVLDLLDAEIAFRDGMLARACELAQTAGAALADEHRLKARAFVVAGASAQVDLRSAEAFDLFESALGVSRRSRDRNEALWGRCVTALSLEDERAAAIVAEFSAVEDRTAADRVHMLIARQFLARVTSGLYDLRRDEAAAHSLLPSVADPIIRTGLGNALGYALLLQAEYDRAIAALGLALADIDRYALEFARPHIEWTLAAAEFGRRQFARSDRLLRRVEANAAASKSYLQLNIRALRARILLAQRQAEQAVILTTPDFNDFPENAMHGEYLATRGLALAVARRPGEALEAAARATGFTRTVETRVLAAAARAVALRETTGAESAMNELWSTASTLGSWDGVVCAVRAAPPLLADLAAGGTHRAQLVEVLGRSNDGALCHAAGLLERRPQGRRGHLSRRENEVLDLLAQGLRTREIASTLYISEATVKVHVRHILEKLGARTRAEAVARYADASAGSAESGSTEASTGN